MQARKSAVLRWSAGSGSKFQKSSRQHAFRRTQKRCRHAGIQCSSLAVTANGTDKYDKLLDWAVDSSFGAPLARVCPDEYGGRCLVAIRDIAPGECILAIPLHRVFASKTPGELDMHWSADLAFRLLTIKHQHHHPQQQQQQQASAAPGKAGEAVDWSHWLACLPGQVVTPLQFTEEEVQGLGLAYTVEDSHEISRVVSCCYEELEPALQQMGYGWQDFLWAVQVLHSRCFFEPNLQQHLCVPGIDMANHRFEPTAGVRIVHNPDSCQGNAAIEEVAPLPTEQAASCFQLIAGEDGIAAGEEVTISYGPWPAEVFLQLFGFLPNPNPNDALVLYNSLPDAAGHYTQLLRDRLCGQQGSRPPQQQQEAGTLHSSSSSGSGPGGSSDEAPSVQAALLSSRLFSAALTACVLSLAGPNAAADFSKLRTTASGFDVRLQPALRLVVAGGLATAKALLDAAAAAGADANHGHGRFQTWLSAEDAAGREPAESRAEEMGQQAVAVLKGAAAFAGGSAAGRVGSREWLAAVQMGLGQQQELEGLALPLGQIIGHRVLQLQEQLLASSHLVREGSDTAGSSLVETYRSDKQELLDVVRQGMGLS